MLQITISKGDQVDGIRLDDQIEAKLMNQLTDRQKVELAAQLLIARLVTAVQSADRTTIQQALQYVDDHVTIQT